MAGNQRVYKHRIRSTRIFQKVFQAMGLIASSRIGQAHHNMQKASPYDHTLSQAVTALGTYSRSEHPITQECTDTKRMAILMVTFNRGMAGTYLATILRETGRLVEELVKESKGPVILAFSRRAQSYFGLRGTPIEFSWAEQSDRPSDEAIEEVATTLLNYFLRPTEAGGVAEVHIVFTRYVSMVSQASEVRRMLLLKIIDVARAGELNDTDNRTLEKELGVKHGSSMPLYEFEPGPSEVFDALLTRCMGSHIRNALLQSAVSELANRQQTVHTAADNAGDLVTTYTRLASAAHQGDITQEIAEIASGADALGTE